ncbi:MAG: hypothetical protein HY901_14115 [Deltaproteobacteria bacterium]|nr:hypothetical protein [Deltaproteobacteria bacterium]
MRRLHPAWRVYWLLALGGQLAAAVAQLWLAPRGFGATNPRICSTLIAPVVLGTASLLGILATLTRRDRALWAVGCFSFAFWLVLAVALRAVFPISMGGLWMGPGLPALPFAGGMFLLRGSVSRPRLAGLAASLTLPAAGLGFGVAWAQRAADADTRPAGGSLPELAGPPLPHVAGNAVALPTGVLDLEGGTVELPCGEIQLRVEPMLTFASVSRDRFWALEPAPARVFEAWSQTSGRTMASYRAAYGRSILDVSTRSDATTLRTWTQLDDSLWSHLNSFLVLGATAHESLSLSFSACGEQSFEIKPRGYPSGPPLRLAWLEPDGLFRVAQASDAEKGPFHELGKGKLGVGDPLRMTLLAGGKPQCHVSVDGWAAQASLLASPTAGWGLPENAIEFFQPEDARSSSPGLRAIVDFSLAATSVGRGFESVGHRPGTYVSRIEIQPAR